MQCDVWLSASRSEGFNLTAMEAMSCRVPVVSTRAGWPEEAIVAGRNGVLVAVDDIDGIADGAVWVLGLDDKAWRATSEYAYQTVAESSWRNSARLFEDALMKAFDESLSRLSGALKNTFAAQCSACMRRNCRNNADWLEDEKLRGIQPCL